MHFGEVLTEEHSHRSVALAYEQGIRIFITADVYGSGKADARISDIAFIVGFQSLSQFNRSISKIVGCSPTKFRKSELTKVKLQA
ncbi:AraC family transcriptional regulator [Akkermansiaceae bacterium]|nr:AraC family transcriptional regulator [Akkermansiaceae bacterium]